MPWRNETEPGYWDDGRDGNGRLLPQGIAHRHGHGHKD